MGSALRLPGVSLSSTDEPLLTEPFGIPGLAYRLEADSYAQAAGSAVASAWPNKANPAAPVPLLTAGAKIAEVRSGSGNIIRAVDFTATPGGQFGVDGLAISECTVAVVLGYVSNQQKKVFDLLGRRLDISYEGWRMRSASFAGTGLTVSASPTGDAPLPGIQQVAAVVMNLSGSGASDSIAVRTGGKTTRASGTVTKDSLTRLRLGPAGEGSANQGPQIVAFAMWNRLLSVSEVDNSVLPAIRKRYGII